MSDEKPLSERWKASTVKPYTEDNDNETCRALVVETRALESRLLAAEEELADGNAAYRQVMEERCATDERHCACVPHLREGIAALKAERDRLAAACAAKSDALEHADEWLSELGCDCGTDEPMTCAFCHVREAMSGDAGRGWLEPGLAKELADKLDEARRALVICGYGNPMEAVETVLARARAAMGAK